MKPLSKLFAFGVISLYLLSPAAIIFAATPPTCQLHLNTSNIKVGGSITLTWSSTNAVSGAITNVGNVGPSGSVNLLPSSNSYTTYIGAFTGPGGTANCSATVQVSSGGGVSGGSGSSGITSPTLQDPNANGTQNATFGSSNAAGAPTGVSSGAGGSSAASGPTSGLVPCGYSFFTTNNTGVDGNPYSNSTGCQACNLAQLVQNLILYLIGIAIPIAAALFAWAGVLYFTSAGDHHKLEQAKALFKSAFIGFLIAISAWLVINTVLVAIFSQSKVFTSGSWFTIQCDQVSRPANQNIADVLSQVLGTVGVITPQVNTSGGPSGGSGGASGLGAYTCTSGYTAVDSGDPSTTPPSCVDANGEPAPSNAITPGCTSGYSMNPDGFCVSGSSAGVNGSVAVDNAINALTQNCAGGDQASCDALETPVPSNGTLTSAQLGALEDQCTENNDAVSCAAVDAYYNATEPTPSAPGSTGTGNCSPAALASVWGDNAAIMSCIVNGESSCNASALSGPDKTDNGAGQSVSVGLYQINLSQNDAAHNLNVPACEALNGGQPLNCSQAFSGGAYTSRNHNTHVQDTSLYNTCVNAASNVSCNQAAAQAIFNNAGAGHAAFGNWGANARNSCGG